MQAMLPLKQKQHVCKFHTPDTPPASTIDCSWKAEAAQWYIILYTLYIVLYTVLHCCECAASEAASLNKPTDGMVCDYIYTSYITFANSPFIMARLA